MNRSSKKILYVISINYYENSLENIDKAMKEHMDFLEKYYDLESFLVSGRKNPRTGGIVIAKAKNITAIRKIMREDPFYTKKLSYFTIIEFSASQHQEILKEFLK